MFDFFSKLFDTEGFPARWFCGSWSEGHGWLHVLSDLSIFGAYMTIPVVLLYLMRKRGDIPFPRVLLLFTAFIAFCGTGHLLEAVIFWQPVYRFAGLMKFFTAIVSWATVVALVPTVREALQFRSPAQLEVEVEHRTRELAREKAKLEAIVSAVGAGVAVLDDEGQPLLASARIESILGFTLRRGHDNPFNVVLGWPAECGLFRLDGTRYPPSELPAFRGLRGGDSVDDYVILRAPHAKAQVVLFVSARRVEAEGFGGVVVAFTDITSQFEAQRQRERTAELEQFAYVASHDLKEPLRQIAMFAGRLRESLEDDLDEDARTHLRVVDESAGRMQGLIDGLLRYARIGGRSMQLSEVDTDAVVRAVMADLNSSLTGAGAEIIVEPLPPVFGDEGHLRQVFQNLISNAAKFRDPKKLLRIEVSSEDMFHEVQFCVKDNGLGIEPSQQDEIFKIFTRLHKNVEGTGVGLPVCKRILERRGGRIWVESAVGVGSTFFFTIPRRNMARTDVEQTHVVG